MKVAVRVQYIGGEVHIYDMIEVLNEKTNTYEKKPFDFQKYGIEPFDAIKTICDLVKANPSQFEIPQLIGLNPE